MAVDLLGGKTEGAPFVGQGFQILDLGIGSIGLQFVVIDQGGQVGQLVLAGAHGGFPHGAFVDLSIPHDGEDPR